MSVRIKHQHQYDCSRDMRLGRFKIRFFVVIHELSENFLIPQILHSRGTYYIRFSSVYTVTTFVSVCSSLFSFFSTQMKKKLKSDEKSEKKVVTVYTDENVCNTYLASVIFEE